MNSSRKKILVPFDFSDESFNALDYAIRFAQNIGATIHLLSLISTATTNKYTFSSSHVNNTYLKNRRRVTAIMDNNYLKDIIDTFTTRVVDSSDKNNLIHLFANELSFDIIIQPSLMTTSENNMPVSTIIPKILVGINDKYESIENIVVPINFIEKDGRFSSIFRLLYNELNVKVHLLNVILDNENAVYNSSYSFEFMKYIAKVNHINDYSVNVLNSTDLEEGIQHFSKAVDAQAIVVPSKKTVDAGSLTKKIKGKTLFPIISFSVPNQNIAA